MAMVINTNIMSLNAQRNLSMSQNDMNTAMERLSSGKRINSAGDDAAGLAISSRLESQTRGINQAIRNANDGISLIQTAEGALQEVTNILQRMRELSVQSANGIYDNGNRSTLDAELQQLKTEINRISETTKFNGLEILNGTLGEVDLQVGVDANESVALEIGSMKTRSLGGSSGDIVGEALTAASLVIDSGSKSAITINDQVITSITSGTSVQDALDSINADLDGFGASVSNIKQWTSYGVGDGTLVAGTDKLTITVTDNYNNSAATLVITGTTDLEDLVNTINEQAGGLIEASVNDEGKLTLTGEQIASISVAGTAARAQAAVGNSATSAVSENFSLVFTDESADQSGVKIELGSTASAGTVISTLGLNVNDDNGNLLGAALTATTYTAINAGDLIINGVEIGEISDKSTAALQVAETVKQINKLTAETGVVAYNDSTRVTLASADGEEISIEYGTAATDSAVLGITGLQERNALGGIGSVASLDISTANGARDALGILDAALDQVNAIRGDLGAVTNRLDFTISNLSNVAENVTAARSRIEDADFASESAALARAQVLQQAGTAMLAQANAQPQQVLSLLQ